ncbi:hypothetical protein [Frigidibacter sp. MR17.24]
MKIDLTIVSLAALSVIFFLGVTYIDALPKIEAARALSAQQEGR